MTRSGALQGAVCDQEAAACAAMTVRPLIRPFEGDRHAIDIRERRSGQRFIRRAMAARRPSAMTATRVASSRAWIGIVGREDDAEAAFTQRLARGPARGSDCRGRGWRSARPSPSSAHPAPERARSGRVGAGRRRCGWPRGRRDRGCRVRRARRGRGRGRPRSARRTAEMGGAAHQHQVEHGVGELHHLRLRHVGHRAGEARARQVGDACAADRGPRRRSAGIRPSSVLNRVVLPAPLGPSRHRTSPGPTEQVDAGGDLCRAVADGEAASRTITVSSTRAGRAPAARRRSARRSGR